MANVSINPLPEVWHKYSERFWAGPAPGIFDGPPTPQDRELALELWRALDTRSKRWYTRFHINPHVREFAGLPLTEADVDSMRIAE
jgi:hypothetical protein